MKNPDSDEPVRIQKVIAQAGVASRRAAEDLIRAGEVLLNGEIVRQMGLKMLIGKDHLRVEGRQVIISQQQKTEVYALYKPKNCITTLNDPQGRVTINDFFPQTSARLFPVGRLDYDAEGLILLTNDGDLAHQLMHPRHKVSKGYFVKVRGIVENKALSDLRKGPVMMIAGTSGFESKFCILLTTKHGLSFFSGKEPTGKLKKCFKKSAIMCRKLNVSRLARLCWVICSLENPELWVLKKLNRF